MADKGTTNLSTLPPGGKDAVEGVRNSDDNNLESADHIQVPRDPLDIDEIESDAKALEIDVNPARTGQDVNVRKRYHEHNGNLQLLLAFAVVIMADANEQGGTDGTINRDAGPALGFASASFILCFLKYVSSFFQSEVNPAVEIFMAFLLLIVWTVGVILLTFQEDGVFFEVSSGFFATWASLLVSGNYFFTTAGKLGEKDTTDDETLKGKRKTKVTDGLNGFFGVGLILTISSIAASSLIVGDTPNRARAISLIVFATPLAGGLLIMNFVPFRSYKDPFYFLLLVGILLLISYLNVMTTLLGEPFAQRRLEGITGQPPVIIANGFFSTLGTFILLSLVLWKSHTFILLFNEDNQEEVRNYSKNIQGRYIWLFLLFLSAIVVLAAAATECSNFESCDDNGFIGPLIAVSFLQAFAIPLIFCLSRGNPDYGDNKIRDPSGPSDNIEMTTEYRIELVAALLFFATWLGSASTFTFGVTSPFNTASAGFFFIWLSAFFSAMYFSAVFPKFGLFNMTFFKWEPPNGMKPENNFGYGLVLTGSLVQVAAVIIALNQDIDGQGVQGEDVLTLVLHGFVLFLLVLFVFLSPRSLGVCALINSYLLISFSFVILLVTTVFANPFDTAALGNGFFAAWLSLYGSFFSYNNYEWDLPPLEV